MKIQPDQSTTIKSESITVKQETNKVNRIHPNQSKQIHNAMKINQKQRKSIRLKQQRPKSIRRNRQQSQLLKIYQTSKTNPVQNHSNLNKTHPKAITINPA